MLEFRLTFGLDVELTTTLNGEREVLLALSCSALELISFWFGEGLLTGFLKIRSRGLFSCFPNFIFKEGFSTSFLDICLKDSIDLFFSTVYYRF